MNNNNRVYVMADLHGRWQPVRDLYIRLQSKKATNIKEGEHPTLIILGDAGLNFFFNHRDEEFKKKLGKYPFDYFIIRGNHEERPSICTEKYPERWAIEEFFRNYVWVEKEFPYIKYAMDEPTLYLIEDLLTLVVPGAYSVDKYKRLQMGWSWFENEQLTEEEMEYGKELVREANEFEIAFDVILSHTCPIEFEPTDLFLSCVDQSMVDKTMERYLGQIEWAADYRAWLFGHYHQLRDYPRTDGRRRLMLYNDAAIELNEYLEKDEVITY